MDRIELARGRWLRFSRPMYVSDMEAIAALADMPDDTPILTAIARFCAVLEPAVAERSWDGPFNQMTVAEIQTVSRRWQAQTEDDALPPEPGTDSETT